MNNNPLDHVHPSRMQNFAYQPDMLDQEPPYQPYYQTRLPNPEIPRQPSFGGFQQAVRHSLIPELYFGFTSIDKKREISIHRAAAQILQAVKNCQDPSADPANTVAEMWSSHLQLAPTEKK